MFPKTQNPLIYETQENDFIGREPSWLINSGTTLVAIVFFILLIVGWFVRYPDSLTSKITISSLSPPAELRAKLDARIEAIYVESEERVLAGQVLMQLKSDSDSEQVLALSTYLQNLEPVHISFDHLGSLQKSYSAWINALSTLQRFESSETFDVQKKMSADEQEQLLGLLVNLKNMQRLQSKRLKLLETDVEKHRLLSRQQLVAESAVRPLESSVLQLQIGIDELSLQIQDTARLISKEKLQLQLIQARYEDEYEVLVDELRRTKETLINDIRSWKETYQVVSPIDGRVSMDRPWNINQTIKSGDLAFNVVPETSQVIAYSQLNKRGAGKVEIGQMVDIELDSYPANEFGKVSGTVQSIALVPSKNGYLITVSLEDNLKTTFNKELKITPNLTGTARIVTKKMSFGQRLMSNLFALKDA